MHFVHIFINIFHTDDTFNLFNHSIADQVIHRKKQLIFFYLI